MANTTLNDGWFWLPSEFLTDNDVLMDKKPNKNGLSTDIEPNLCFPSEFPYEFGSFGSSSVLSSPVESVVGSTESESDEDDFLTGLTRQLARSTLQQAQKVSYAPQNLEKTWVLSGSPQSTLSAVGSWSGRSAVSSNGSPNGPSQVPSPPTTPLVGIDDGWDLIYAAAGQVARLKMNGDGPPKGRGLICPRGLTPVQPSPLLKIPNNGVYSNQFLPHNLPQAHLQVRQEQVWKQQSSSVWRKQAKEGWVSQQRVPQNRGSRVGFGGDEFAHSGTCGGRPLVAQSAWPTLQVQHRHRHNQPEMQSGSGMRAVFLGGSDGGVKRECAGTGVFLPRRYGNPTESHKKPGCSTALLPARVVQALSKNFDDITIHAQPQAHPCFNGGFIPEYDVLMARRNALFGQQKRSIRPEAAMNHEVRLPQEWTY